MTYVDHKPWHLEVTFLNLLINSFFINFFIIFFIIFLYYFLYKYKNVEKLSAKYYQENKEKLQIKACERYQNLSKEEKRKKATIWSWTVQKSTRRWKTKTCWL